MEERGKGEGREREGMVREKEERPMEENRKGNERRWEGEGGEVEKGEERENQHKGKREGERERVRNCQLSYRTNKQIKTQ